MNDTYDVMAEALQQEFVTTRNFRLTANDVAKLALHRGERRFDVRARVILRHVFVAVQLEVVKHLVPERRIAAPGCIGLERDKRLRADAGYDFHIRATA